MQSFIFGVWQNARGTTAICLEFTIDTLLLRLFDESLQKWPIVFHFDMINRRKLYTFECTTLSRPRRCRVDRSMFDEDCRVFAYKLK